MASHDDVPPPPYTETDIYSVSGAARSAGTNPRSHTGDDAASLPASTASSSGEVIYTPPLTPRSSNNSHFASNPDHLASSSAAAYFESRPAHTFHSGQQCIHPISVGDASSPDDFAFPTEWTNRDVTVVDWQTFLNYLIPHHAAESNSQIIDRKLRAEGTTDDSRSEKSGRSHAEAQLGQIRSPVEAARTRRNLEDTIREWNDGFFAPRGITIRLDPVTDEPHIPGGWDQSFDQAADPPGVTDPRNRGRGGFGRFNPFGAPENPAGGGLRLGRLRIDGDTVSFGDTFVADRNGVRIGGLMAGNNGISRDGVPFIPGAYRSPPGGGRCAVPPGCQPGGPWSRGSGPGLWDSGAQDRCDTRGRKGRGRDQHREGRRRGARSRSSSSDSSSSSSSSSDSSVGSLPDYDDLRDAQLPVTKNLIQNWLNHPDQPITKESVKRLKEEIKSAKKNPPPGTPTNPGADVKALRREVRGMLQQWKSLKRQQKQQKLKLKRQLREAKKAARRERRAARREARHARRSGRRGQAVPPAQPIPPAPPAPSAPHGFPFGLGRPGQSNNNENGGPGIPVLPAGLGGILGRFAGRGGPGVGGFGGRFGEGGGFGGPWRGTPPWGGLGGGGYPCGRGFRGRSGLSHPFERPVPGQWPPAGAEGYEDGHENGRVYGGSQAKLEEVAELEKVLEAKKTELDEVRARARGGGNGEKPQAHSEGRRTELELEAELDGLLADITRLRIEADEQFAREIAAEDAMGHHY